MDINYNEIEDQSSSSDSVSPESGVSKYSKHLLISSYRFVKDRVYDLKHGFMGIDDLQSKPVTQTEEIMGNSEINFFKSDKSR